MKKNILLLLLFALGCHSGSDVSRGPFATHQAKINAQKIDPSTIQGDPTLGCHDGFPALTGTQVTYENVIDGKPGTYRLNSAFFYNETHSISKKNTSTFLITAGISDSTPNVTAKQSIGCTDLHEVINATDSPFANIPQSISRPGGEILNDVSMSLYVAKGKRNPSGVSFPPKILAINAAFPYLKNFIAGKGSRLHREVQMTLDQNQELRILITDQIVNVTGSTAIHKIFAVYSFSGT